MKTVEFNYKETPIHFLVNPMNDNLMINATEMAKIFDKRVDFFTKSDHAKAFIEVMENNFNQPPYGGRLNKKIIDNRGRNGIYFERRLALKFAAWLSPEFEYWIYTTIDEIVFGNYKKHWEAHAVQEQQKQLLENLKSELLIKPTPELVASYFECEREIKTAKSDKSKAIRNQIRLFDQEITQ